jgi:hypothetical protein
MAFIQNWQQNIVEGHNFNFTPKSFSQLKEKSPVKSFDEAF